MALDCKLPVIAAMQGHGIGAGWSLGMFADVVLLSEESQYVSPYMNYGFTPGAGATWILADKMGNDLARESLLTGEPYSGSELKARGLRLPIVPRAELLAAAMELARQIAQGSRRRLIGLKQQLTAYVQQPLWKRPIGSNWPCMRKLRGPVRHAGGRFKPDSTRSSRSLPARPAAGEADEPRGRRVKFC